MFFDELGEVVEPRCYNGSVSTDKLERLGQGREIGGGIRYLSRE